MINGIGEGIARAMALGIVVAFVIGAVVGVSTWEGCKYIRRHVRIEVSK